MQKKLLQSLALAGLCALAVSAQAQSSPAQSPWQVRVRAVNIDPDNKSGPLGGVGPADQVLVSTKTIPEVDISYYFTPNIAAELILTYPQKHDVSVAGTTVGSFKHLPPTLTLQYHFLPQAQFDPYLGAGLNYTRISNVNLLNGSGTLSKDSAGLALQAGVDFHIDRHWSVNFDVKKLQLRTDVGVAGTTVTRLKVDPLLIGVGVGYRF
ncbi:MAG: OmpW family protein [Comamonadaceae bacterium]|nr:MAG: OmpW family protein [Comamonadaceae bacterium]